MEECVFCKLQAAKHPIVGVGRNDDGDFDWFPVCAACWRSPLRRERYIEDRSDLKMHFFPREEAEGAVDSAGSEDLIG